MLFAIESDTMSSISLYLIPDAGGAVPWIVVSNDGVELLRMRSNVTLPHLIEAGRHATGECGFKIETSHLPDLADYANLEVREADSGLLVYRRHRPSFIDMRLFRLETHLLPLWRLDDALQSRFQYWFKGIDRMGRETSQQTFLTNSDSSFASGRLQMRNIERFIPRGLKVITMIRDPYDELAERMIILKTIGKQQQDLLGARDAITFEHVIAELGRFETLDVAACKRFFRRTPGDILKALSNPFVRQLTVTVPDDMPPPSCIGMSLQMLAEFTILGLRSDAGEFALALSEFLEIDETAIPVIKQFDKVVELGNILRQFSEVETLLEYDLELFHHTQQAIGTVAEQAKA